MAERATPTTATLPRKARFIELFLDLSAVCSNIEGEPGSASNAGTGSNHTRPLEGAHHG